MYFIFVVIFSVTVFFIFDLIAYMSSNYRNQHNCNYFSRFYKKGEFIRYGIYIKMEKLPGVKKVILHYRYTDDENELKYIDYFLFHEKGIFLFHYFDQYGEFENTKEEKYIIESSMKSKTINPYFLLMKHQENVSNIFCIERGHIFAFLLINNKCKFNVKSHKKIYISDLANFDKMLFKLLTTYDNVFTSYQVDEYIEKSIEL